MTKKPHSTKSHDDDDAVELHDEHFDAPQTSGEHQPRSTPPAVEDAQAEIERLRNYIKTIIHTSDLRPPCILCGYNDVDFYNPDVHPCMVLDLPMHPGDLAVQALEEHSDQPKEGESEGQRIRA